MVQPIASVLWPQTKHSSASKALATALAPRCSQKSCQCAI